ncbi:MAG: hypothetical protein Q9191_006185 [Dirinaria sp. TL-2023a]
MRSAEAQRALEHVRKLQQDRENGTVHPRYIPPYDPTPPPASPTHKRKADYMDNEETMQQNKKQRKALREPLSTRPTTAVNAKVCSTERSQTKRSRDEMEIAAVVSLSNKRQKVDDRNGGSAFPPRDTATGASVPRGAVAAHMPTDKSAQEKSGEQASVTAKQETSGQKQSAAAGSSTSPDASEKTSSVRTYRGPRLDSVLGFGKSARGIKPAVRTVRKVVTTSPARAQHSAPAAAVPAPAPAPAPAPGQKRKCENDQHSSPKKARTQGNETSRASGKRGTKEARATAAKKPKCEKPTTAKPRGFLNYEKNCYANAVIQCLGTCEAFATYYKAMADDAARADEKKYPPYFIEGSGARRGGLEGRKVLRGIVRELDEVKDISISSDLGDLLEQMENSTGLKDPINPVLFLNLFAKKAKKLPQGRRFDGESAVDPVEFFQELLHQLDLEQRRKQGSFADPTDLNRLFGGQIVETVRCSRCAHVRYNGSSTSRFLSALHLSLPHVQDEKHKQAGQGSEKASKDKRQEDKTCETLWSCVDHYTQEKARPEMPCTRCRRYGGVTSKLGLGDLSPFLAFTVSRTNADGTKNQLPILPQINPRSFSGWAPESGAVSGGKYELCGIVEHIGPGTSDEHYIAMAKTGPSQQDWWALNDRSVRGEHKDNVNGKDCRGKPIHGQGVLFILRRCD